MCKLRQQVRNGHFSPMNFMMKDQISNISNLGVQTKFLLFILGLQKHIASIRLYKNTTGLYIFESFRRETKILFDKSELNY